MADIVEDLLSLALDPGLDKGNLKTGQLSRTSVYSHIGSVLCVLIRKAAEYGARRRRRRRRGVTNSKRKRSRRLRNDSTRGEKCRKDVGGKKDQKNKVENDIFKDCWRQGGKI